MGIAKKIQRSLQEHRQLRFETNHLRGDSFDGVAIVANDEFIAINEIIDFEFDGIVVLPRPVLTRIRDGKYDRCANEILTESGEIERLKSPAWLLECGSVREVIEELRSQDIWPAVEIVYGKKRKNALYLGPIMHNDDERFSLRCYDAAGKWESEYWLSFDEIFKIEIDSRYVRKFNAYMRLRPFE